LQNEIYHVAVAPLEKPDDEIVGKVAAITVKDVLQTRMALTGKIPKLIAHCPSLEAAEDTARQLKELKLITFVIKNSDLKSAARGFRAVKAASEADGTAFFDKTGASKKLTSRDVFLIISGKLQTSTDKVVTTTKMKFNVGRTLLTGMPAFKRVKEKSIDTEVETEGFVRLFDHASPQPAVEITQHGFDYSFLGDKMASSSIANFAVVVNQIKQFFPDAIFDDRLAQPMQVSMPSASPRNAIEISSRLIYWYYRTIRSDDTVEAERP
jgi:hypothetical protein